MLNSLRMLTILGALVACSGCLKTIYMASPDGYVTTQSAEGGEYFRVRMRNDFTLWGLAPRARLVEVDRAVSFLLKRDVRNISNLRIRQEVSPLNLFMQVITIGIYAPRTIEIEGMIHKKPPFPPHVEAEPPDPPAPPEPPDPGAPPR